MKKSLLPLLLCCLTVPGFAQANNPYNQKGIDYVNSLNIISADIKAGRVKEFSAESVKYYTGIIPLKVEANADMAATIVKRMKSTNASLTQVLAESNLSTTAKQYLHDIYYVKRGTTTDQYKLLLEQKSSGLLKQDLAVPEKEMLLSLSAIAYNRSKDVQDNFQGKEPSGNCILSGDGGSGPVDCILAGAILGATIGWRICGLWCALGGAVIGGVAGAFS
ncbi:MAG: hypothetical protein H7Y86_11535 [Rhizobacter sp.]|nr:hypothetical protein [Ferruginibacter sp.]